jgi:DNA-binding ferritin-like protein (Dps family)
VDLHADPLCLEIELLPELFDDALADVAERSDVIGEDVEAGRHEGSFLA